MPDRGSILPTFTPSYPCELENAYHHVDFCMVHASPELSYPCSQTESAREALIGRGERTLLIQRDYHFNAGCWTGVTYDVRSLRLCDSESGASTPVADYILGDLLPSPDGAWFAFVAEDVESSVSPRTPHIFRVRSDGTDLVQLDPQPFPQDQVVGVQLIHWSEDGAWLEVSLWDGRQGGTHHYNLSTDGSGQFDVLP